jgi:hypothetical protein
MSAPVPRFANDDEAAQHWLTLLRSGTDEQEIQAREQLAAIFERRGMFEEATDLLVSNVRAGVQNADIFRWLARLYRAQGDEVTAMQAAAEAAKYLPPATPITEPVTAMMAQAPYSHLPHQPGTCDECGYVNVQRRSICKRCRAPLEGAWPEANSPALQYDPRYAQPPAFYASPRVEQPRGGGGSRIAALVLGVVGGIFGIFAALFALSLGGIGGAFGMKDAAFISDLGMSAMVFCLLGFLGAGLALPKPVVGGVLLLIAAIGFMISVSWFAIVTTPMFLLAAMLAFMGRR